MRTQPETRARSSQEAGKRALNLGGNRTNQACIGSLFTENWSSAGTFVRYHPPVSDRATIFGESGGTGMRPGGSRNERNRPESRRAGGEHHMPSCVHVATILWLACMAELSQVESSMD